MRTKNLTHLIGRWNTRLKYRGVITYRTQVRTNRVRKNRQMEDMKSKT